MHDFLGTTPNPGVGWNQYLTIYGDNTYVNWGRSALRVPQVAITTLERTMKEFNIVRSPTIEITAECWMSRLLVWLFSEDADLKATNPIYHHNLDQGNGYGHPDILIEGKYLERGLDHNHDEFYFQLCSYLYGFHLSHGHFPVGILTDLVNLWYFDPTGLQNNACTWRQLQAQGSILAPDNHGIYSYSNFNYQHALAFLERIKYAYLHISR